MADWAKVLDERPIVVALAGPNGAGKSTFYESFLRRSGLPLVNADELAVALRVDAYEAAAYAAKVRETLAANRQSFVFETVLSDPVGEKVALLRQHAESGFRVVILFIGVASVELSRLRVAMRASQGGHDIPDEKLAARFPRVLDNLVRAAQQLPHVIVFDNSDLRSPYRRVAQFEHGELRTAVALMPAWLAAVFDADE